MRDAAEHPWASRPGRDLPHNLILFYGVCNLCSGWARFVLHRNKEALFHFLAIQTPMGRKLAIGLCIDPINPEQMP